MSEADEMFEKLGYKKTDASDYGYIEFYNDKAYERFYFDTEDRLVQKEVQFTSDICSYSDFINMQELQAINKKCEELGWIK